MNTSNKKKEILAEKLKSRQRLIIDEIAERLEVSTMPVRDAVRHLDTLGFLMLLLVGVIRH